MSYEKKLLQMKALVKKNVPKEEPKKKDSEVTLPFYTESWEQAGLKLIKNDFGYLFMKETFYSKEHIHGNVALNKLEDAITFMQRSYPNHPLTIAENHPFCFYDTETTGLKGTGVLIFLNGLLKEVSNGLLLTQHVLADPGQEAAFLFASDFWKTSQTLITYNGKSFDYPQLESRWVMNRNVIPKLKSHEQIDLLHSSKRVWKGELERFKLIQVEENKLDFIRKDDIPGHLAPIIYFDSVKHGNPNNLMKVLKHNEWDILSLVALYIKTVDLLKEKEITESAVTYTNIGKWFQDLKTTDTSFEWFQFITGHFPSENVSMAYYYLGLHLKRRRFMEESIDAFQQSLVEISGKYKMDVYVELAKLYEHQKKDYDLALEMTQQSLLYLEELGGILKPSKIIHLRQELQRRNERIIRKRNISRESAELNKKRVGKPQIAPISDTNML